jgi:hypothetical protein
VPPAGRKILHRTKQVAKAGFKHSVKKHAVSIIKTKVKSNKITSHTANKRINKNKPKEQMKNKQSIKRKKRAFFKLISLNKNLAKLRGWENVFWDNFEWLGLLGRFTWYERLHGLERLVQIGYLDGLDSFEGFA